MDSYISLLPINKYNSKKTNRGENSDSLPIDLILEILPRLPAKSIGRFRCVSKLWRSMLSCPDFTKLFLTRSSARPRLLFAVRGDREWSFYSSPQPQNPYGKSSSLVVAADFHIKFRADAYLCIYTSGLIYFPEMWFSEDYEDTVPMICNPITGQYSVLPKVIKYRKWHNFFGFDPIDNQFKVLLMGYPNHRILTLGTGEMMWREIQFPGLPHRPCNKGICINGVLYYIGDVGFDETDAVIVCFDVRTETFKFVDSPSKYTKLINYKGKLGGIKLTNRDDVDVIELRMWVLEDVEKQEFSNYVYTLPENNFGHVSNVFVDGVTATGEIVLSTTKPSYVFYFNLERNTLICVEIQGLKSFCGVDAIVDHVEDLNLNDAKQLKSSRVECHLEKPKTSTTTTTTTIS